MIDNLDMEGDDVIDLSKLCFFTTLSTLEICDERHDEVAEKPWGLVGLNRCPAGLKVIKIESVIAPSFDTRLATLHAFKSHLELHL
ncbi:hypothetical protein WJX72_007490 [[Myrmecia] bisecta]|uniref:Uncharacterized protein n=1 Tax=[Myrmecia] bisecta TaxID=41462 RepID=A0AAW1QRK2_9CHLO